MKSFFRFIVLLIKKSNENELLFLANVLTYKLLLSLFPFIIFLMSLVGFFSIDSTYVLVELNGVFPDTIYEIISVFVHEVFDIRSTGVLSASLALTLFSASSGFNAVIIGINKAYGEKETRGTVRVRILSIILVLVLTFSIILSIAAFVFGDKIFSMINNSFGVSEVGKMVYGWLAYMITMGILLVTLVIIYKFASVKKVTFYSVIPGAMTTLLVWIFSSKIFNIYINNFSKFSMIYGSVASIFIMIYWLNIISIVILVGGQINALLNN